MTGWRYVLITAVLAGAMPAAAMADDSPAHLCDSGAGSPDDADLPPGAQGKPFADLDPTDALEQACIAASTAQPTKRRFLAHLGRLYAKRGQTRAALEAYRLATGRGSAVAANNLGTMYARGEGVIEDQDRATQLYRKAAHRGLSAAMLTMAVRSRTGRGTPESLSSALFWYERAHEAGDVTATNDLGVMYQNGYAISEDDAHAVALFHDALSRDHTQAAAARNLAKAYETGEGVDPAADRALGFYTWAFKAGHADSADDVGRLLAEGAMGEADPVAAAEWYARGARAGSIYATVSLADAYADGVGVDRDTDLARTLYQTAFTEALSEDAAWRRYIDDRMAELPEPEPTE